MTHHSSGSTRRLMAAIGITVAAVGGSLAISALPAAANASGGGCSTGQVGYARIGACISINGGSDGGDVIPDAYITLSSKHPACRTVVIDLYANNSKVTSKDLPCPTANNQHFAGESAYWLRSATGTVTWRTQVQVLFAGESDGQASPALVTS